RLITQHGGRVIQKKRCSWLKNPREIDQSELNSVVGSVAHLAYHVGAIRQIDLSARGPSAAD
ncbi:MAG: hypothetical protein ABI994_11160, partial [Gemmatimonadales bacterium]